MQTLKREMQRNIDAKTGMYTSVKHIPSETETGAPGFLQVETGEGNTGRGIRAMAKALNLNVSRTTGGRHEGVNYYFEPNEKNPRWFGQTFDRVKGKPVKEGLFRKGKFSTYAISPNIYSTEHNVFTAEDRSIIHQVFDKLALQRHYPRKDLD